MKPSYESPQIIRKFAVAAALLYFALAVGWSFPVVPNMTDHVIGDSQSDIWTHLWGYWRTERAFFEEGRFPLQEDYLNYPYSGKLFHVDFLNSLAMIPLKKFFGLAAGYNLLVWLQLMAGGMGMFWLLRELGARAGPSVLAGLLYAFNPYMITYPLASGVSERLNIVWIPLFLLLFIKIMKAGRPLVFLLAGLCCVFAALGCWKYFFYLYLLSLLSQR